MKKVALILMVVVSSVVLLTSCTDNTENIETITENNESLEVYNVDKKKIKRPGSQG